MDDPIILLRDSDSSASKAKVNNNGLCTKSAAALGAGLFNSLETAIDLITLAPLPSSNKWHNINNFPKTAPRLLLTELGASK